MVTSCWLHAAAAGSPVPKPGGTGWLNTSEARDIKEGTTTCRSSWAALWQGAQCEEGDGCGVGTELAGWRGK